MIPNLNINLNDVDTTMPVLAEDQYIFTISDVKVSPSKKDQSKNNLVVTYTLAQDGVSTKGEPISPGYKLSSYLPLQQSDNPKAPDYRQAIAKLIQAAFPTDTPKQLDSDVLIALIGKEVAVRVKVRDDEEYGLSNDIGRVSAIK